MSYNAGTYIDLSHLNQKNECSEESENRPARFSYDAGTQLIFKLVNGHLVTARKITVAIA